MKVYTWMGLESVVLKWAREFIALVKELLDVPPRSW